MSTESNRFFLWSLFQSFQSFLIFQSCSVCFTTITTTTTNTIIHHIALTRTNRCPHPLHRLLLSTKGSKNEHAQRLPSTTHSTAQSFATKPDGPDNQNIRTQIETLLSTIETDIATVQSLVDENVSYGQNVYESIQQPTRIINIEELLLAGQQRFETVQHLAKESREAYLRQRKIMWLWVFLAIVLAGGAIYMYIWVSGLGGRTERTGQCTK